MLKILLLNFNDVILPPFPLQDSPSCLQNATGFLEVSAWPQLQHYH